MGTRKKIVYMTEPPEGLFYIPEFLTVQQEEELLIDVSRQPFEPYDHHGYKANREVSYFGAQGGYNGGGAEAADSFPEWLIPTRDRFAKLIGLEGDELTSAMIARYTVGAGIGWHRDRRQFGPSVFGISLFSDAEMRFRRYVGEVEEMYKINLERRSAYIIGGLARSVWQHGMNPVKQVRYSITFRTYKDKQSKSFDMRHTPQIIAQCLGDFQFAQKQKNIR